MTTAEFTSNILKYEHILRSFSYTLTRNDEEAKDLFQETTYRAVKNQEKFAFGTNLKAWLFTIMKNIFINDYRKKRKANTFTDASDEHYFLNTGQTSAPDVSESRLLIQEMLTLVDQLEDNLRIPFLMHYQGFKYKEIAGKFDLPLGTVKSRIFFARRILKEQIRSRYSYVDELLVRA